jgi:hypothetical protein
VFEKIPFRTPLAPHAPAHAMRAFQYGHVAACARHTIGGRQAGYAGADYDDLGLRSHRCEPIDKFTTRAV